jgi:hypothetical protein
MLRWQVRFMLMGVNLSKIDPHVKKSDADDQQEKLLESDHHIQQYPNGTRQPFFFKVKRDNGDALDEIDGQQHQQTVDADQSDSRIRASMISPQPMTPQTSGSGARQWLRRPKSG